MSLLEASAPTPLMRQYRALKTKNPDALLLFRLGDFYGALRGGRPAGPPP